MGWVLTLQTGSFAPSALCGVGGALVPSHTHTHTHTHTHMCNKKKKACTHARKHTVAHHLLDPRKRS